MTRVIDVRAELAGPTRRPGELVRVRVLAPYLLYDATAGEQRGPGAVLDIPQRAAESWQRNGWCALVAEDEPAKPAARKAKTDN